MLKYLIKRLVMMLVTLFGITLLSFVIINLAPGSPIEQKLQALRFGGGGGGDSSQVSSGRDSLGVSEEVLAALKRQYGFDKPLLTRFGIWLANLAQGNFGRSFSYEEPVIDVIISKFPVSLQFGLLSLILTYLICIPLGIAKAIRHGSQFDLVSSGILFALYSVPAIMLAILLRTLLAGQLDWFPLADVVSDYYETLDWWGRFKDRVWHFALPLTCYMVGSFTVLTYLMKNSFLEELKQDYVRTARSKGLSPNTVYYLHVLRNALIPIVTGIGGFLGVFFAGSVIIEQVFNLDGIGLLGYSSVLARDYNVIMALIFLQSLVSLLGRLISDLTYVWVDPRIRLD